jgi:hypothetical protein
MEAGVTTAHDARREQIGTATGSKYSFHIFTGSLLEFQIFAVCQDPAFWKFVDLLDIVLAKIQLVTLVRILAFAI